MSNLKVVVYRKSDTAPQGHIIQVGYSYSFCGDAAPTVLLEQLDDPRSPYVGKGKVTCPGCLAEYHGGRTGGHRGMDSLETPPEDDPGSPVQV